MILTCTCTCLSTVCADFFIDSVYTSAPLLHRDVYIKLHYTCYLILSTELSAIATVSYHHSGFGVFILLNFGHYYKEEEEDQECQDQDQLLQD